RKSVGPAPTPTWARYTLYVTVKAVLSGETATAAVPAGHPEPLTVTMSMMIRSGGGLSNGSWAAGFCATAGGINIDKTTLPIAITLSTKVPLPNSRDAMRHTLVRFQRHVGMTWSLSKE